MFPLSPVVLSDYIHFSHFYFEWQRKIIQSFETSPPRNISGVELESRIFESLFQRRMLKAP